MSEEAGGGRAQGVWVRGGGEMAALVRAFAWSGTPLGPLEHWPAAVRVGVNLMLALPTPASVCWGPELLLLYNDAYRELLGERHPRALGSPSAEVWPEAWEYTGPGLRAVLAGAPGVLQREVRVPVYENAGAEPPREAFWNYTQSALHDEHGAVAGVFVTCQEITRAVLSARMLRASEARILASIGDAVIVTDTAGHVTRMNPVAEGLTGWSEDDACGNPLSEVFHIVNQDTRLPVESPADKVRRLGTVVGLANHTLLLRKDGTEVHIDDSGAPIRDDTGTLTGIVLVFRDVTEKWEGDRRLAAQAGNHRFLLELTDQLRSRTEPRTIMREAAEKVGRHLKVGRVGYGEISEDGETITFETGWADSALGELSGAQPFRSFGAGNVAMLKAGQTAVYDDIWHDARTADRTQSGIGVKAGIGVPILREGRLSAVLYLHHGTIRHWTEEEVALVQGVAERTSDAVERARTRQTLELSEEELRYTVTLSEQVPWTAAPDGSILNFGISWLETTGLAPEDALGQEWTGAMHPDDAAAMASAWTHSVQTGDPYNIDHRVRTASGEYRWQRSRALPRKDAQGRILKWYGMTEDIHTRKLAEQALIQSEKLAAVGRLASSIAHEINNPLEAVTNLIYLARGSATLESARAYLETADRELRRVSAIANQTLRFHKQSTKPTEVAATDLLESVLSIYQGRIVNSGVLVELEAAKAVAVRCFAGEIRQVLNNLVGNSIDAMHPAGGRLLLRGRAGTDWRSGRKGMVLTVADTGSGMSAHTIAKAFEPFFTTKGITGTGLGLWISKEIMERHEGHLQLRSSQTEGRSGTVTTLFLPFDPPTRGG